MCWQIKRAAETCDREKTGAEQIEQCVACSRNDDGDIVGGRPDDDRMK